MGKFSNPFECAKHCKRKHSKKLTNELLTCRRFWCPLPQFSSIPRLREFKSLRTFCCSFSSWEKELRYAPKFENSILRPHEATHWQRLFVIALNEWHLEGEYSLVFCKNCWMQTSSRVDTQILSLNRFCAKSGEACGSKFSCAGR